MVDRLGLVLLYCVALSACASANDPAPARSIETRSPAALRTEVRSQRPPRASDEAADQRRCLALNLYWEARGEGRDGMRAVGWTVLNRIDHPEFPATVCGVVRQGGETPPCQFSWWCDGRSDRPGETKAWTAALAVAGEMLADPPPDPTDGALFYHNLSVSSPWKKRRERTARIGQHIFYR